MMELTKLLLKRLISLLLVLILFACDSEYNRNRNNIPLVLETVLSTYIQADADLSSTEDCILISQINEWGRDSLVLLSINRFPLIAIKNEKDLYFSTFKGIKICLQYFEVVDKKTIPLAMDNLVISNQMNWKLMKAGTINNPSFAPAVYGEYYETDFLYDPCNICINRESIVCAPQLKDSLINKCSAWMCD